MKKMGNKNTKEVRDPYQTAVSQCNACAATAQTQNCTSTPETTGCFPNDTSETCNQRQVGITQNYNQCISGITAQDPVCLQNQGSCNQNCAEQYNKCAGSDAQVACAGTEGSGYVECITSQIEKCAQQYNCAVLCDCPSTLTCNDIVKPPVAVPADLKCPYWICDPVNGVVSTTLIGLSLNTYKTQAECAKVCKPYWTCSDPNYQGASCTVGYTDNTSYVPDGITTFSTADACGNFCGKQRYGCAPAPNGSASACVAQTNGPFVTNDCNQQCQNNTDSTPGVCVVVEYPNACYDQDFVSGNKNPDGSLPVMTAGICQNIQQTVGSFTTVNFVPYGKCSNGFCVGNAPSTCSKNTSLPCTPCPIEWANADGQCVLPQPFAGIPVPQAKCF